MMLCPVCKQENLVMTERSGIEIDYCPQCRGVWLDRGELDKIIERSSNAPAPQAAVPPPGDWGREGREYRGSQHERSAPHQHGYPRRKKREGFLADIFDFD